MKKILFAITILISSLTFGQDKLTNTNSIETKEISNILKRTNAEYALELINNPAIERVFIVLRGYNKEYNKEDIKLKTDGEYLIITVFRKGTLKTTHRWMLKDVIFIQEYENVIKVRLDAHVGE